ncbi:MAG: hypothetical protein HY862_17380 [Chloroflexi bacterium]|nr:hypothetical protein [Chloroflexota bacterium]
MNQNPSPRREPDAIEIFLRTFLGLGAFIAICSVVTWLSADPDKPEYYVSICNIFIGLALVIGVVIFIKVFRR